MELGDPLLAVVQHCHSGSHSFVDVFFTGRLDGYLDWPSTTPKKFEREA